jgi:NADH-quinone oxidoreductase subunit J
LAPGELAKELAGDPVFAAAALVSVVSGILTVSRKNPVYSAIWMLVCFLAFAVLYLKLGAPFLAAIHVLVYTGAILVLFLFVIMLLNLKPDELGLEYGRPARAAVAALCATLFALLAFLMLRDPSLRNEPAALTPGFGGVRDVGARLFNDYALPFELISVLILVAVFGGVVLAKKKL